MDIHSEKFNKIVGMLGSSEDGEALNALHLANAMLRAEHTTWAELIHGNRETRQADYEKIYAAGVERGKSDAADAWQKGYQAGAADAEVSPMPPPPPPRPAPARARAPRTTRRFAGAFWTFVVLVLVLGMRTNAPPTPAHSVPQVVASTAPPNVSLPNDGNNLYLSAVRDDILRKLVYPPAARHLEGIAEYGLRVDRQGRLLQVRILQSSGKDILDKAGMDMIRRSAPLRPLPSDIKGNQVDVVLTVHFAP